MMHYFVIASREGDIIFSHHFSTEDNTRKAEVLQAGVQKCIDDSRVNTGVRY